MDLLSDLGGILGLFIGFSVMTILEFVELFLDIVMLSFFKCFSSKSTNDVSPEGSSDLRNANNKKFPYNLNQNRNGKTFNLAMDSPIPSVVD